MLKVCFDCLAGNRQENDSYGTTLNSNTFRTPWPTSQIQNRNMFRLPRELHLEDKINISGIRSHDRESFVVNLMTGSYTPDNQNVACKFEANYDSNEEQLILSTVQSGQKNATVLEDSPSDYFPDQYFSVSFELRPFENNILIDINAGVSPVGTVTLQHNLRDITYITLNPDTVKVNELKFSFA